MANRMFSQLQLSLEKAVVKLWAKVAIGATGAPTLSAANSKGISSITRAAAGNYTITLQDKYVKLLGFQCTFMDAAGLPDAPMVALDTDTDVTATSPIIHFYTASSAGVAADPANGETMYIEITLSNSGAL